MNTILAIDDDPMNLAILEDVLRDAGYQVDVAEDGEIGWTLLRKSPYDLILLDRMMPNLDGMSLLRRIKADKTLSSIPVIMQTAASRQEDIREGLEAGAYYYLTKPFTPEVLRTLVAAVDADFSEQKNLRELNQNLTATLGLISEGSFPFRTLPEARALAAGLSKLCANPIAVGHGLLELLINAVEHGNLGITYAEKSALRQNGEWEQEIERRLAASPWCGRKARVTVKLVGNEIEFVITDEGEGFDWKRYLHFDPDRAFDLNGRGIAMVGMAGLDYFEYKKPGNTVVVRATRCAIASS